MLQLDDTSNIKIDHVLPAIIVNPKPEYGTKGQQIRMISRSAVNRVYVFLPFNVFSVKATKALPLSLLDGRQNNLL